MSDTLSSSFTRRDFLSTSAKLGMELEAICGTQGQDPQECFANGHKNTLLSRVHPENSL